VAGFVTPSPSGLLDWNLSAEWAEMRVSSVTKDWPQKALADVSQEYRGMADYYVPGVLGHVSVQLGEIESSLLVTHGHGFLIGACKFFRVPRIDNDAAVQTLGCTGELGKDQDSVALLLCGDVFVGHQVHTVASGRDNAGI
jgi:hypothetical protein